MREDAVSRGSGTRQAFMQISRILFSATSANYVRPDAVPARTAARPGANCRELPRGPARTAARPGAAGWSPPRGLPSPEGYWSLPEPG